jgi:hypothetical protein
MFYPYQFHTTFLSKGKRNHIAESNKTSFQRAFGNGFFFDLAFPFAACQIMWVHVEIRCGGGFRWELGILTMYTDSYITHRQSSLRVRYHQFHTARFWPANVGNTRIKAGVFGG